MHKWNPIVLILIGVNDDNRAQNRAQSRAQKYAKMWLSQACGRCRYAKKIPEHGPGIFVIWGN